MPAYNMEDFIYESIKSILIQTYQQFELIIVDDGSTDRTLDVIRAYNDPRIKLIINKNNQGIVAARNTALKASTGNYIAMLDADDIAFSNRLEIQIQYLNEINIDLVALEYYWVSLGVHIQHYWLIIQGLHIFLLYNYYHDVSILIQY